MFRNKNLPSIKTENQYSRIKFYHSDGTGRDAYIAVDNGGLTQSLDKCLQPPIGTFNSKKQNKSYMPAVNVKVLHYLSDGSGRDKYVIDSHGGLMNTQNPQYWLTSFKQSLRQPEKQRPKSGYTLPSQQHQYSFSRKLAIPKHQTITFQKRVQEEMKRQQNLRAQQSNIS